MNTLACVYISSSAINVSIRSKSKSKRRACVCVCVFLTSSNSVLRAPNSHVARYVYAFNFNPLWWCLAQQRGRDGRIHAQCFIDDRVQVNQGGNVLVRYIRVGIRHVRSELVAQLLDLFWVSGKFEHDVSQSCSGGIAMIPSWLASRSTTQRLLIQDQLIFTFQQQRLVESLLLAWLTDLGWVSILPSG